ncbi:hypothetical protein GQ457_14G000190 [Hibiscus cannabinus]
MLLFTYLDLPLGINPRSQTMWDVVIARFRKKLAMWKKASLSFAVRVTLVNSVLSSLPIYYMGLFIVPKGAIDKIDRIWRAFFLWGGVALQRKLAWIRHRCGVLRLSKYGMTFPSWCLNTNGLRSMSAVCR